MTRIRIGARVLVRAPEGGTYEDVVTARFTYETLLVPYAPNVREPALALTTRSWCRVSDVLKVLG